MARLQDLIHFLVERAVSIIAEKENSMVLIVSIFLEKPRTVTASIWFKVLKTDHYRGRSLRHLTFMASLVVFLATNLRVFLVCENSSVSY